MQTKKQLTYLAHACVLGKLSSIASENVSNDMERFLKTLLSCFPTPSQSRKFFQEYRVRRKFLRKFIFTVFADF